MSKYMTESEFDQWIKDHYREFCMSDDFVAHVFGAASLSDKKHGIIIINKHNGKVARSYCHPEDKWDYTIGIAIAYAHYMGVEIPKIDKTYFIEDLVGKEVVLPASFGTSSTVFVTPYKRGGYQIVVNGFTGLSLKVHPRLLIREHDIKDIED